MALYGGAGGVGGSVGIVIPLVDQDTGFMAPLGSPSHAVIGRIRIST